MGNCGAAERFHLGRILLQKTIELLLGSGHGVSVSWRTACVSLALGNLSTFRAFRTG